MPTRAQCSNVSVAKTFEFSETSQVTATDRQPARQTDSQPDRKAERQTDRRTYLETRTNIVRETDPEIRGSYSNYH